MNIVQNYMIKALPTVPKRCEAMMIELKEGELAPIKQTHTYAIVAITKHGVELARKLHTVFSNADLYYMNKFEKGDEEHKQIQLFSGSVRILLPRFFNNIKDDLNYFPRCCRPDDCSDFKG